MWEYVLVFVGAAVPWIELALVVPVGIIAGLNPYGVMIVGIIGNLATVYPVIFAFDRVQAWYTKRQEVNGKASTKKNERAKNIWNRYGLPGLALIGPIFIGTHIAALFGMSFGGTKRATFIWLTISIVLWAIVFGVATMLGFSWFVK